MNALRFLPYISKQITRHSVRSLLTAMGIAVAMFLFTTVQAMHRGVAVATQVSAMETTLVVYRKDRYCPATSELPQSYQSQIERIDGVVSAVPMKVVVSNCRTSLDVVIYRGIPKDEFLDVHGKELIVVSGSIEDWKRRTDAALIGRTLATRRGLRPGMTFDAAGITTYVAGVIDSDNPQDQNVAYTSLEFVQLAGRDRLGIVTQFLVTVDDPDKLESVASTIDDMFHTAQEPTSTFSEKAFVGRIATDIIELVNFARWLGIGSLAAVLALVANAVVLSVQSRVAEHAVLQTLGYTSGCIARLIMAEGVFLALIGGGTGALAAVLIARIGSFALSVEGQSIPISASPGLLLVGVAVCGGIGIVAGLAPAFMASRRDIASCFRAV